MAMLSYDQGRFAKLYNEAADELLQADLTLRQLKLVIAIIRRSLGESASTSEWTQRAVTITELAAATHLDRKDAERTLKQMCGASIIERQNREDGIHWRYSPGWTMGVNHPPGGKSPPCQWGQNTPINGGESPPGQNTPIGGETPPDVGGKSPPGHGGESPPSRTLDDKQHKAAAGVLDSEEKRSNAPAAAMPPDLISTLQGQVGKRLVMMQIHELYQQYGATHLLFAGARVAEEKRQRAEAGRDALGNPVGRFVGILKASSAEEAEAYFEELKGRVAQAGSARPSREADDDGPPEDDDDPIAQRARQQVALLIQASTLPAAGEYVPDVEDGRDRIRRKMAELHSRRPKSTDEIE